MDKLKSIFDASTSLSDPKLVIGTMGILCATYLVDKLIDACYAADIKIGNNCSISFKPVS